MCVRAHARASVSFFFISRPAGFDLLISAQTRTRLSYNYAAASKQQASKGAIASYHIIQAVILDKPEISLEYEWNGVL